ncbi:MAG: endonuclease [Tannerella sp.]|nr:endonuclease [Tannerella sp.]
MLIFNTAFTCGLLPQSAQQEFKVMFYNVENLFDLYNDPETNDDEFLPDGGRRWTPDRYYARLRQTARVINAVGAWDTPALVGLCEVENDTVLTHLLNRTPLRNQQYRYCMTRGNDARGINNALLYQRDKFKYLGHASERIHFSHKEKRSRDILHVWGQIITSDTLDVFVCHFPSRWGGEKETEQSRIDAARQLRKICDSLYKTRRTLNLLIMGDFNDTPLDKSIQEIVKASEPERNLINLCEDAATLNFEGTHKYQGEWIRLDQIMVSQSWNRWLKEGSAQIYCPSFLLTEDKSKRGKRPLRTYYGYKYEGGYSDHLPVVADFLLPLDGINQ